MELQNQAILWSEPELVGWVEKRGDRSTTWNRRFFLLQGAYIFYYIKNNDIPNTEPVGVIPLEGASIKDEDDSESGRRFCFLLRLSPELATFAKRASYHISAPSQEAKVVWMHALQMASYSRAYLMVLSKQYRMPFALIMPPGELQGFRERASDLESQLAKSPKNLKELQRHQGHESSVLQKEIQRVTEAYKKLKEEAIETCAEADKVNMEAVRALAIWEIYTDYISGRNHEGSCHTIDRLNAEAALTNKLLKLLTAKRRLMGGEGIEHLSPQALEDLDAICQRGLKNILERQFQVRVKAPRYTSSVHPALLPKGCDDPVARISHALDIPERNSLEKRRRKSTSFQLLKGSIIIPEKKDNRGSPEGKGLLLSDYLRKSEGPPALEKSVASAGGSDKDHTVLEVEDEPQEGNTESDEFAELEGEREIAEIKSSTGKEHSSSSTPLEHLARKGLQKLALQKSLEVWVNSPKEQPPSSPPNLQKPVSQEPPGKAEMSTTEQQPPKSPPISQKRVSFLQPASVDDDSRSQSSTDTSPQEPLTNDSRPPLRASAHLEASSSPTPTSSWPTHNIQLLTRPQWVQVRPQTFNIIGPASIHTHDGGLCSSTPGIDPHSMQGIIRPSEQSPPIASKSSEEQSLGRPLEDEQNLFDRSMQINLYKSGEDQCACTAASNMDCFRPTEEQNVPVGSVIDRHSVRKEQDRVVGLEIDRRSLREEQSPPTGSIIDRHSLREEQGPQAGSSPDRHLLKKEQDPAVGPKSDQLSLREERSPAIELGFNRHSLREEPDFQVGSSPDRCSLRKEQNPSIVPKSDRQSTGEERSSFVGSSINRHSLREEQGFQVGSGPNRYLVRKEQDPLVEPKIDRRSLHEEQSRNGLGMERSLLREEEGGRVGSSSNRHSQEKEQDPPVGPKTDWQSLREERSPSVGSGIDRRSVREKPGFQAGSSPNRHSLREGQIPLSSSRRIDQLSLRGEEKDGIPNRLQNSLQSSLGDEESIIPIRSTTKQRSIGEEQRPLFVSMTDRQSLKDEEEGMIPIRSGTDRRSLREELGLLPDRHSRREEALGLSVGSRIAPRSQSAVVRSVLREAPSDHPVGSRADQRSTFLKKEQTQQSPPPHRQIPLPVVAASKSSGYIEAIIPPRLRALFQKMQPKPRNEYTPPRSDHASPSAVIVSGTKRGHHASPPRLPPSVVPVSTPPTASTCPKQKRDDHHVKWTHPLSPPPQKWTKPRAESILSPPPPASGRTRPQSDMQHLLWSHPRAENIGSPTEKVCGRQSPRVRNLHQATESPRCSASHRCSKRHHSPLHQHLDRRSRSLDEFRRVSHTEQANQHQPGQAQPGRCSHQCQHYHHKHSTCRHDQEEDHPPAGFHCDRTPRHNWNITSNEDCIDGWFAPAHPSEKCLTRDPNR